MRQVIGLEDLGQRFACRGDAEPRRRIGRARRLVAQRLPQPAHAIILPRRAGEHRDDQVLLKILGQVLVDFLVRRLLVLEQLFQESVVEIGEFFDEAGAGGTLAFPEIVGERNQIGGLARAVAVGALADQIDIAGDFRLGPAQRHLAQHQRAVGHRLQRRQHVAHPRIRGIELVDVEHVRDVVAGEKAQQRADRDRALDLGLAHHDDDVGDQHRLLRLIEQLDRAGAIEDRPGVAEKGRVGDVDLGRHAAGARLGGVIADRIAVAHAAAAGGRAAGEEQRFEQRRLARQIGADQGDTAGGSGHRDPPLQSGPGRYAACAAILSRSIVARRPHRGNRNLAGRPRLVINFVIPGVAQRRARNP